MTDDELWMLVVDAERAMEAAIVAQKNSPPDAALKARAALRDQVADATLTFTRLTNQWQKRTRGEA